MANDLVTIETFTNGYEAEFCKAALEEVGIFVNIRDHNVVESAFFGNPSGMFDLQVAPETEEDAREIVARVRPTFKQESPIQASDFDDDVMTCFECGAAMPDDVDACPKCGWSYSDEEGPT